MNDLDHKIHHLLERVGDTAPPPPHFDDLHPSASAQRSRLLPVAAAVVLVAVGVGGVIAISDDGAEPTDRPPAGQTSEVPTSADGVLPPVVDVTPAGAAGPLLQTEIVGSALPLLELAGWETIYAYSDENLPLYGGFENAFVMIGDGPTYDAPLFAATSVGEDELGGQSAAELFATGDPIEVGAVTGSVNIVDADADSKLAGPVVFMIVPLEDGRVARFNSVRLAVDDVAELAASFVRSANAGSDEMPIPDGFRRLDLPDDSGHSTFSIRFRSPDGAEVEVVGENRGWASLLGRIASEVRTTRVVDGVEFAYRPQPDSPGSYWADWKAGDWSFYAMADGFETEDQFFSVLGQIQVVDELADRSTGEQSLVSPANRSAVVDELLVDVPVPPGFDPGPLRDVGGVRDRYQEIARVSGAVTCGWLDIWFDANDAGDPVAAQAAADGLATSRDWPMLIDIESAGGWSSAIWEMADAVNGGPGIATGGGLEAPTRGAAESGLGCTFG